MLDITRVCLENNLYPPCPFELPWRIGPLPNRAATLQLCPRSLVRSSWYSSFRGPPVPPPRAVGFESTGFFGW
jgi:hypothetical protein